jgi:hypothetical protein
MPCLASVVCLLSVRELGGGVMQGILGGLKRASLFKLTAAPYCAARAGFGFIVASRRSSSTPSSC